MSRLVLAAGLLLLLAGCADARQSRAAHAVRAYAVAHGSTGIHRATCTRSARIAIVHEVPTQVFICVVQFRSGACDRYRARLAGRQFVVRPLERRTNCTLP